MPERRPRIPSELAEKIDRLRGDVPFERWVRRVLEDEVNGTTGEEKMIREWVEESAGSEPPESRVSVPPAPPEKRSAAQWAATSAGPKPSALQLSTRARVTESLAKRWLESGEWEQHWP